MDLEILRRYLGGKPGAREAFPFGPEYLVFKVGGKMFALVALTEDPLRVNLKCDPEKALVLRDAFPCVLPGYHMNKRHWNTVVVAADLPGDILTMMLDDSYTLVVAGLPRSVREGLS